MFSIKSNPLRVAVALALLSSLILLIMYVVYFHGQRLAEEHSPLVNASLGIKLEATTGHLWLEELTAGDASESIASVWSHLEKADSYALAMLQGGSVDRVTIPPLSDLSERQLILLVRQSLADFRLIAEKRYQNYQEGAPGSELDEQLDKVFHQFILDANKVESNIKLKIESELKQFNSLFVLVFLGSIVLFAWVITLLYRSNKKNRSLFHSLEHSNLEIAKKNQELDYKAHFDILTGLPNRTFFQDQLIKEIERSELDNSQFALLFVDLDNFKAVNDRYGHHYGDQVLIQSAKRLIVSVSDKDIVTRVSGDEFIVIIKNISDISEVKQVSQTILDQLSQRIVVKNITIQISASIGISIFPTDSHATEQLINFADTAMYHSKTQGKNSYSFHSARLVESIKQKEELEQDLSDAITSHQLVVYYQSQHKLANKKLYGFEALVRWQHPTRGLIPPTTFIDIAETNGLIIEVDFYVFESVLQQLVEWREYNNQFGCVSVNFSPITFESPDFVSRVEDKLAEFNLDGNKLVFEFVETTLIKDLKHTQMVLSALRKLGIKIAIDDFGTGYSSMSYLKDLPADILKIDRSFIAELSELSNSALVLKHIIALAYDLNLEVVAEGIETGLQEIFLKDLSVGNGQGFYYSKPLAPAEIAFTNSYA